VKRSIGLAVFAAVCTVAYPLLAQNDAAKPAANRAPSVKSPSGVSGKKTSERVATIHWQRVPLRDALGRLSGFFTDHVFVDRRVDPSLRVTLDIEASSAADVIAAIASDNGLSSARFGTLVYLGPNGAADQLRTAGAARSQEIARLPADLRASVTSKQTTTWPRLAEPRGLVASIVEQRGWHLTNAEKIPHDLWPAGSLPNAALNEQLSILLIGFDLTFALRPNERSIELIALNSTVPGSVQRPAENAASTRTKPTAVKKGQKQVYTLRVKEKPVRAVLEALKTSLHWAVQIDEEAIRASGGSLDNRVSFFVENADREHLLEALLKPAGLDYQIEGDVVRIIPQRYANK
jgi:hypothetical protein